MIKKSRNTYKACWINKLKSLGNEDDAQTEADKLNSK